MDIKWTDMTTYSQSDKIQIPRIYAASIDSAVIKIHRHIHYPKTWLLTCYDLDISQVDLMTDDFNAAEEKAISLLINYLNKYIHLQKALVLLKGGAEDENDA